MKLALSSYNKYILCHSKMIPLMFIVFRGLVIETVKNMLIRFSIFFKGTL